MLVDKEEEDNRTDESSDNESEVMYTLDGQHFETYQDMVDAKRLRNDQRLIECGLIQAKQQLSNAIVRPTLAKPRKRKAIREPAAILPRRTSNRIAGVKSDGMYVEHEGAGRFTIGGNAAVGSSTAPASETYPNEPKFFNDRINDGADLSIKEAIELAGPKWVNETSVAEAEQFATTSLASFITSAKETKVLSPNSVVSLNKESIQGKINRLSINDNHRVAKVTPDRIYSIVCHPSTDSLIVGAGDKQGFVGLWNLHGSIEDGGSTHLFHFHTKPICCLEWTPRGDKLMSSSYDGSVRSFDVASQIFTEIFAVYDDSTSFSGNLGRGIDQGYRYWIQHVSMDHRFNVDKCFFMSSSVGTAMHVDLRVRKGKVTFMEELSEQKINTLSLHPDGFSLASAGLDCTVRLWDTRKFGCNDKKKTNCLASYHAGRSVNSAYFSPSGSQLVATTQMNTLDILNNFHLATDQIAPTTRVKHDNQTGRWLTTFQANWHPSLDVFVVGSMQRPRAIELFDSQGSKLRDIYGDALTAVASRCCFHPSTEKLIVVGGNSSGRVSIAC